MVHTNKAQPVSHNSCLFVYSYKWCPLNTISYSLQLQLTQPLRDDDTYLTISHISYIALDYPALLNCCSVFLLFFFNSIELRDLRVRWSLGHLMGHKNITTCKNLSSTLKHALNKVYSSFLWEVLSCIQIQKYLLVISQLNKKKSELRGSKWSQWYHSSVSL